MFDLNLFEFFNLSKMKKGNNRQKPGRIRISRIGRKPGKITMGEIG
jgi:hypothetical protein